MSALTSNDLVLNGICPNILMYEDRHIRFSESLVKFNLELDKVKDDPVLFFNVLTYKLMEEYFQNLSMTASKVEGLFNSVTWTFLKKNADNIKLAATAWVRLFGIYTEANKYVEKYSGLVTPNLEYKKALDGKTFHLKIDLLLMKGKEIHLLTVVPFVSSHKHLNGVANVDTLLTLDYLLEADIPITKVIEISYSSSSVNKKITTRELYANKKVVGLVDSINRMKSNRPNIFYCNVCPYRKSCNMDDVIHGKKK